jgi:probable blue pigment (indigoidine) exporter
MKQLNPITLNTVSISAGLIVILIEAAIFTDFSKVHFTFTHAWTSAYLGTLGTVVTFVVYYRLLQQTRALTMAYIALITPVVAVTLGWLIAHERFDGYTIFGSLLVLLGVWVALRTPSGLVTAGDKEVIETFAEEQELYP